MTSVESLPCDDHGRGDVEVQNDLEEPEKLQEDESESADLFNRLPPEMVTSILEHLEKSAPLSLLSCRLTCHRFRDLVDDLLEKQQGSLWDWSKYYGEAKPFIQPGPLKRHLPVDKIFSKSADITSFLKDMEGHLDDNPFPNRGIYLRRVKSNPPEEASDPDNPEDNLDTGTPQQNKFGFLGGLGLNDNQEENEAYLLSLQKINLLLTPFGSHLTSLIFESGVTADLKSLEDLRDILERTPNLQYLMLKGIRIHKQKEVANSSEHLQSTFKDLPQLPNLKSLKVIRCHGILESLVYAYHNQLETFQVINTRDNYFPHLTKLLEQQRSNSGDGGDGKGDKRGGLIFGKLRELKMGEFGRCKELDHFVDFIKGVGIEEEGGGVKLFPKLDHLSIQYNICDNFGDKPVTRLFGPLEYLPRLKEFNVGVCENTGFKIGEDEINGRFNFGGGGKLVTRLSVPVQLIRYPILVERLVREMPAMEILRFLRNDEDGEREEFSEKMEQVLDGILKGFSGLNKVEIVDVIGDRENKVCGVIRKIKCGKTV